MLVASLYIIWCSLRNRVRQRLKRLREPRYLLGGLAGAAYLWFFLFGGPRRSGRAVRRGDTMPIPELFQAGSAVAPTLAGLPLLGLAALTWLLPPRSDLLAFSNAETDFLFPAPVRRWELIVHRLLRSQLGLLFAAIVPALFIPAGSSFARVRWVIAMWIILATSRMYSTGVVLARTRLRTAAAPARSRARIPRAGVLAAAVTVAVVVVRDVVGQPSSGWEDTAAGLAATLATGASAVVLWPFAALAGPLFAPTLPALLAALPAALLVLALTTVWTLRGHDVLEEAAADASARSERRRSEETARYRGRPEPWTLRPIGRPETALAWKAAVRTTRALDVRLVAWLALPAVVVILASSVGGSVIERVSQVLGVVAIVGLGWTVLIGPQAVRMDLRDDLEYLDALKSWPVRGAAVLRGEMIWPALLLTLVAWLLIGLTLVLSGATVPRVPVGARVVGAVSLAALVPGVIGAQYLLQNALTLLFPAWIPIGRHRPRGIDAMGQRLLVFAGTLVALIFLIVPSLMVGGVVWLASRVIVGSIAALVPAGVCGGVALLVEVALATEVVGPLYEKLDLTGVERGE